MMKKIKYFVPHLVAILTFTLGLSLSFATGAYFGYANRPEVATITALANKEIDQSDQVDFSAFWKTWNLLNEKYVSDQDQSTTSQKITDQEKVWGAIAGLVASLGDPYTVFLPPEKKKVTCGYFSVSAIRNCFKPFLAITSPRESGILSFPKIGFTCINFSS